MKAFDNYKTNSNNSNGVEGTFNRIRNECIIAFKVYDSCRQQDCLDQGSIGAARAAEDFECNGTTYEEGEIITPPTSAAAVSIEGLSVTRVVIVSKEENPFRRGYWDIDLKYIFEYILVFRDVNGDIICAVPARSIYNKKVTLFGSTATNSLLSTDLLTSNGNSLDVESDPFVLVESKAVALTAELQYPRNCCDGESADATEVNVTIGLFTIIKLYRLVNLTVQSAGFCIPEECSDVSAISPCEYFESLDFPLDIFAPPQKKEFMEGVSSNIPADLSDNSSNGNGCDCGCGCGCGCKHKHC